MQFVSICKSYAFKVTNASQKAHLLSPFYHDSTVRSFFPEQKTLLEAREKQGVALASGERVSNKVFCSGLF
jgi:hypothetical protein